MEKITILRLEKLPSNPSNIKPSRLFYTQNGKEKGCDILKVPDSVSIVIFNVDSKKLVLVRQFRPAVYHSAVASSGGSIEYLNLKKYSAKLGITLELCGGMIDNKLLSPAQVAREKILEKCGFDVPVGRLKEVLKFNSAGPSGASQTMFYCKVCNADMKKSVGADLIEVVEYRIKEAKLFVSKGAVNNSPTTFLVGIHWFLAHIEEKKKKREIEGKKKKEPTEEEYESHCGCTSDDS